MNLPELILWSAAVLLAITAAGLLISRDWRWSLGLLALQYLAAFFLMLGHWPLSMAAARLVVGWMAATALGMTHLNLHPAASNESSWPQGSLFRMFASGLVLLAVSAAANTLGAWLPASALPLRWGALVLIGLGLLHLGMTLAPLRVILGLLTTLLGFEVLFSTLENSILVVGLMSVITLGLALAGSYLLILNDAGQTA
jgi:hypothetical protein